VISEDLENRNIEVDEIIQHLDANFDNKNLKSQFQDMASSSFLKFFNKSANILGKLFQPNALDFTYDADF
jgi:isocitrate dehydrogenase kinase/phosphatase